MTTPEAKPELPDLLLLIDVASELAYEAGEWDGDEDVPFATVAEASIEALAKAKEAARALLLEVARLRESGSGDLQRREAPDSPEGGTGPADAATASPEHDSPLLAFVRQSNAIEGITRPPTKPEVEAHKRLLSLGVVEVADLEEFVRVCADARLRRGPGMDVRVGPHLPPRGGPQIEISLRELLADIQEGALSPWKAHVRYETLHPFMDGNGRSGRALWLWQMRGIQNVRQPLGFLHAFYYQTLQGSRS